MSDSQGRTVDSSGTRQDQFLTVVTCEEAHRRFRKAIQLQECGTETVCLEDAAGRILAEDIVSTIDVPNFDRSNVDGFAVRAADTIHATEDAPRTLTLNDETITPGHQPAGTVHEGTATPIATGGMLPRGADAVLMIEWTDVIEGASVPTIEISRSVSPGESITFAGTDIARGETVLWKRQQLTSREIGVLAAIGHVEVPVFRRPRIAIISTGDEVIPPGEALAPGCVYDSNAAILSAAVRELGGDPIYCGTIRDDLSALEAAVTKGLDYDAVVLSGGTSKGSGDLSYRVVQQFDDPGIVVHGVSLKPGKPICLAVTRNKPVVVLPGFPTSAVFTFHEFVAPLIRELGGQLPESRTAIEARLPFRLNSTRGRTEYSLVRLFDSPEGLTAFPLGKGSGSVTTFSTADGFITIPQHSEIAEENSIVSVTPLDRSLQSTDLVVIGSHCPGLDLVLSFVREQGIRVTTMHIGSQGGLAAIRKRACDVAGIHLLDPETGSYNHPFLRDGERLVTGYRRMQCLAFRPDDDRFQQATSHGSAAEVLKSVVSDPACVMVNRNAGSGTRLLIDRLLSEVLPETAPRPAGYAVQPKSHNAVVAAILQHRADWGVAIAPVVEAANLSSIPIDEEQFDFVVPKERWDRPAVRAFVAALATPAVREALSQLGYRPAENAPGNT